jgi:hypothetical protein
VRRRNAGRTSRPCMQRWRWSERLVLRRSRPPSGAAGTRHWRTRCSCPRGEGRVSRPAGRSAAAVQGAGRVVGGAVGDTAGRAVGTARLDQGGGPLRVAARRGGTAGGRRRRCSRKSASSRIGSGCRPCPSCASDGEVVADEVAEQRDGAVAQADLRTRLRAVDQALPWRGPQNDDPVDFPAHPDAYVVGPTTPKRQPISVSAGQSWCGAPAGIEPATLSLPWIGNQAPCYPASSQVARHRTSRSHGLSCGP